MGRIKRAIQEIQDKGWPVTNESLTKLFREKQKKILEEKKKKENET